MMPGKSCGLLMQFTNNHEPLLSIFNLHLIFLAPVLNCLTWLLAALIPKDDNLVVFHGTSIYHYNENSRYFYEYLSGKSEFKAVWITQNQVVYDYLVQQGWLVVWHRSLRGLWMYLRAGFIIGTGTSIPTLYKSVGCKTKKICLNHGMGPRSTNAGNDIDIKQNKTPLFTTKKILRRIHQWDYFNFTSRFTEITVGKLQFILPKTKRIICGYPRCDHLFNRELNQKLLTTKPLIQKLFPDISPASEILLYAPTWRFSDTELCLPFKQIEGFSMQELNNFLENENLYLVISIHSIVQTRDDLSSFDRLRYLPNDPCFDINLFLPEVSILITDFSSIMTDFALMNRPIMFIMPDYEEFLYDRGLLEDFRETLPGREAKSMEHLKEITRTYKKSPQLDSQERLRYLNKYYDTSLKDSNERLYNFVKSLRTEKD